MWFMVAVWLQQLRKMLELLVHASQCGMAACLYPKCRSVKGLFRHGMTCKVRASGGCNLCKRMWYLLQLHARACKESECRVPRCKYGFHPHLVCLLLVLFISTALQPGENMPRVYILQMWIKYTIHFFFSVNVCLVSLLSPYSCILLFSIESCSAVAHSEMFAFGS